MSTFIQKINILSLFTSILLIASCANVAYPIGGPTDQDPPKLLEAKPADGSTHFSSEEITFSFDEYIALKNASAEFLSSPPLNEKPKFVPSGKGFKIILDEELLPNTTYNFSLGNAVTDNNEGNILRNFSYIFSTGDYLDSLEFDGIIKNAFTLTPEIGVFVGLYTSFEDSVVAKEKPRYVAKTDSSGYFKLKALKGGDYKIFAFRDLNNNLKYDLVTEDVAFDESSITPTMVMKKTDTANLKEKQDSISLDTLKVDSVLNDSLRKAAQQPKYEMLLFPEVQDKQSIISAEFLGDGHLLVAAKKSFKNPQFSFLFKEGNLSFLSEYSAKRDSLNIWFLDKTIDSLSVEITDHSFRDTILVKKKRSSDKKPAPINILKTGIDPKVPFFTRPVLEFRNPIAKINDTLHALLIKGADTLDISFFPDSLKRKMTPNFTFQEDSTYTLIVDSAYFSDIYEHVNSRLSYTFKLDKKENYGNFLLKFETNSNSQFIVQLLNDKSSVVKEYLVRGNATLDFPHLKQGNYSIKFIDDANENGIWDSGNYWKHQQPEKVRFFNKPINIRENWDLKENFSWE